MVKPRLTKSVLAYAGLLTLVGCERLFELRLSRRNVAWLRAHGGIELAPEQLRWMTLLHTALLAASLGEVIGWRRRLHPGLAAHAVAALVGAQALRYWAVRTLGRRWSVRIVVLPGAPAVTSGPYRFIRHPNYLAVTVEALALPLVHGAYVTAAIASVVNAIVLRRRIAVEESALRAYCDYANRLGTRPRFWPALPFTTATTDLVRRRSADAGGAAGGEAGRDTAGEAGRHAGCDAGRDAGGDTKGDGKVPASDQVKRDRLTGGIGDAGD